MKIYLGGSIHGGREFAEGLKQICTVLKEMGHQVLTEDFVVNLSPADFSEKRDDYYIVKRDLGWVEASDALIAEVSRGSHGVGYEHRHAEGLNKPILLLRNNSLSGEATRSSFLFATGYPKLRFAYYNEDNLQEILQGFFQEFLSEDKEGKIVRER